MQRLSSILLLFCLYGTALTIEAEEELSASASASANANASANDRQLNCNVVAAGTTSCVGTAALASCSNSDFLLAQFKAGITTALICQNGSAAPASVNISLRVQGLEGFQISCFLVSMGSGRTCDDIQADNNVLKSDCNDQSALKAFLDIGPNTRICLKNKYGIFFNGRSVPIIAKI